MRNRIFAIAILFTALAALSLGLTIQNPGPESYAVLGVALGALITVGIYAHQVQEKRKIERKKLPTEQDKTDAARRAEWSLRFRKLTQGSPKEFLTFEAAIKKPGKVHDPKSGIQDVLKSIYNNKKLNEYEGAGLLVQYDTKTGKYDPTRLSAMILKGVI